MGTDIHIYINNARPGSALCRNNSPTSGSFTYSSYDYVLVTLKKWDNVGLTYLNWSGESVINLQTFKVTSLTDTTIASAAAQPFITSSNGLVRCTSGVGPGGVTPYSSASAPFGQTNFDIPLSFSTDEVPSSGYQFIAIRAYHTSGTYTEEVKAGILIDSGFSLGLSGAPAEILCGNQESYTITSSITSAHSASMTGVDSPSLVITGTGLVWSGTSQDTETKTVTNGQYTHTFTKKTYTASQDFTLSYPSTFNNPDFSNASTSSPVIGYAVSSSDSGQRLHLDRERWGISYIANGSSPGTLTTPSYLAIDTLMNDRNTTSSVVGVEGIQANFPSNEAGTVGYGYIRQVKIKWTCASFTYGVSVKIDTSDDGSAWTNRANSILPSADGVATIDLGSAVGCSYFRVYFVDAGTAATIQFYYIIPIGLMPGPPVEFINASTGLPFTSEEFVTVPTPSQTFSGAISATRDVKIINRHPTAAYTVELAHTPGGTHSTYDPLVQFANLSLTNTSDVAISPFVTIPANSSYTVRLKYVLGAGSNALDGTHVGRLLARLVRLTTTDARVFFANGSTDDILAYDFAGTLKETYTGSGLTPAAVAVDPWTQELYMLHAATGTTATVSVWKLGATGGPIRTQTITNGAMPSDTWTTLACWMGYLFVGGSGSGGKIIVADARSASPYIGQLSLTGASSGDKYMAVSPEGYLFVATGPTAKTVEQWNLWTQTKTRTIDSTAASGSHTLAPTGLGYDSVNRRVRIWTGDGANREVFAYAVDDGSLYARTYQAGGAAKVGNEVFGPTDSYVTFSTIAIVHYTDPYAFTGASVSFSAALPGGTAPLQAAWLY